ncbi:MAG: DUF599 family protein [Candidatus Methanoperedens sp.]|nr:DUF599 family protein [Candidatus Methanoperedens sp.]
MSMAEDDGKLEEWMYDFAWKGRDAALQGINILENKAMNIINFSSILITILAGVLFFIKDKGVDATMSIKASTLIVVAILFFIVAILFAFFTIRVRKHSIIPINKQFEAITEFLKKNDVKDADKTQTAMGKTAKDLGEWQWKLIELNKEKSRDFKISSWCFVLALILILISSLLISISI